MPTPKRGEVWLADLGLAAKTRPVLVLSVPFSDHDYALITVVPHTTSPRGSDFEVNLSVPSLRPGALQPEQMKVVEATIRKWLGFQ